MNTEKKLAIIPVKLLVDEKIVIETCQRIGIGDRKNKILYPSCYLWKDEGSYYIVHFKELFVLTKDNAFNNISEEDILRRNAIIYCLKQWKLIDVDEKLIEPYNQFVFVLSHKDKSTWQIKHKISYKN
jgi:hypothetical protein